MGQYTQAIQKLYVAYFSRPADPGGITYWENTAIQANGSLTSIRNAFSTSSEYRAEYANKATAEVVDQVYINLFGRHAEASGLQYWSDAISHKLVTVDYVMEAIASGAQGSDFLAYNLKVRTATLFTDSLDTAAEILGYTGNSANALGKLLLSCVTDDDSYAQVIAPNGKLDMILDTISGGHPVIFPPVVPTVPAATPGVAIGEPMLQLTGLHEMADTDLFMV